MVSGVLLQRLARGVEGAVALLDGVLELLLALLLVELDPRLDGQLRGLDRPVVDGVALVVEAAQLVQAVLDLLRQQLVVGAEALGLGPVGGGCPVDRGPLPEQGRSPLPAAAVDVADREAALALELVDEGGESGGQAGEGGAAGGPVALGLALADADQGEDGQHQQGAEHADEELGADGEIANICDQPCVRRGRKAVGRYRPCQDRGDGGCAEFLLVRRPAP